MIRKSASAVLIVLLAAAVLYAMTGREIIDKANNLKGADSAESKIEMIIFKGGRELVKEFEIKTKKVGGETRTLSAFIKPTKMKVLSHAHAGRDDDQWIRLSSGKVKRIVGGERDKPFAGSHMTYDDLESRETDDFTYNKLADATTMGTPCYVVEAVKTVGTINYSKIVLHVRKADFFVIRVDFYKHGKLFKFLENNNVQNISGILTPMEVIMTMANGEGKTILKVKSVQYNIHIPDSVFSKGALGK